VDAISDLRAGHARAVHVGTYTLMRPGELMAFDWLDIDLA
jgi:hypothetical protein